LLEPAPKVGRSRREEAVIVVSEAVLARASPAANGSLLQVEGLSKVFAGRQSRFGRARDERRAVDDVSLEIRRGEAFGVVGESGCGKSTLARLILRLIEPTAGSITFDGLTLTEFPREEMRQLRRRMQLVFQDPYSSLNPRMSVFELVKEPLVIHGVGDDADRRRQVYEMLELVGISELQADRKPHEFSGGQRQRIAIARALVAQPEFVVLDEPVSALDVSIQAQVLNLLKDLQERLNLTYMFIVHDLAVAEHFCDRVAVLYLGKIMELADNRALFAHPLHPYSQALVSAAPIPDPAVERNRPQITLRGELVVPVGRVEGCRFEPRCPVGHGREICRHEEPPLRKLGDAQSSACHFSGETRGADTFGGDAGEQPAHGDADAEA
jgi:oligopeptide/dipeptide ABC transporter ATP-binding protein